MRTIDLNGTWTLAGPEGKTAGLEGFAVPSSMTVPGSLFSACLETGSSPDPFWRENERLYAALAAADWTLTRDFDLSPEIASRSLIELVFEGIDTLSEVYLNGAHIGNTADMHRTWKFNLAGLARPGKNTLTVRLLSPTALMQAEQTRLPLPGGSGGQYPGFCHLRKAHSMSGWDWGPVLPDLGIWRPAYIALPEEVDIRDVYIVQTHSNRKGETADVELFARVRLRASAQAPGWKNLGLTVSATAPDGSEFSASCALADSAEKTFTGFETPGETCYEKTLALSIPRAMLWWPNGLGAQHLYDLTVVLSRNEGADAQTLDEKKLRLGLRTLSVRRDADEWGESFAFEANGTAFFAMGADYVPEDSLIARNTRKRTERLVRSAAAARHNCIRVWGGANYPEDDFYDLCDEYGLVIWHDHMMACGVYELSPSFRENIVAEIIDNVKRVRHHASLGLWCGNNEQEEAWCSWGWSEKYSPALKADYIRLYEEILPALNRELDPETFYWLSSPSSGGSFFKPNAEERGDMHNWTVWHGLKPFTAYRECYSRFMSEFGIESFPSMKTIEAFTLPEDRNIFSPVMEAHQKCDSGNAKILHYISANYRYPRDFEALVYASQLIQAEGLRYGVEHWRRNRNGNRCMGAVYWQLNDCWPVASWASIDWYGRWKALHYMSRRFFAPVLLSACETGSSASLHVTNETARDVSGTVLWRLIDESGSISGTTVLSAGSRAVRVPAWTDAEAVFLDFSDILADEYARRKAILYYSFVANDGELPAPDASSVNSSVEGPFIEPGSRGSVLFVPPKHYEWKKETPTFAVADSGDRFEIRVSSAVCARSIELDTAGFDALFSDNYFDLAPGETAAVFVRKDEIWSDSPAEGTVLAVTAEQFARALKVRTVADIG